MERLKNLDDDQLSQQVNMLKNNKAMMKMNYKMQFGIDLSEEQCDNMLNMMTPDMMKMAKNMYT